MEKVLTLSVLVHLLEKSANDPFFVHMEKLLNEQVQILFDEDDVIRKFTVPIKSKIGADFLHSASLLIGAQGKPTYTLNFPQSTHKDAMLFYNFDHYWLGLKYKENVLESVVLMSPSIISEVVKFGYVPIRTCRSSY